MLVLSRRPHETITFPTLGISVEIVRVHGQAVRLGIQAPSSVPVLRGELNPRIEASPAEDPNHRLRGQLNAATMALYVAQKQLESGAKAEAEGTISEALEHLMKLEESLRPATMPTPRNRAPRALLVEDNPNEQSLLSSYLRLSGMEVDAVNDGIDALDYLTTHDRPDAVLLDLQMPRFDGTSTLAAIRENLAYESMKVFIVSGSIPDEPSRKHRIDGWFRKPLNPAMIVEKMSQVLGHN